MGLGLGLVIPHRLVHRGPHTSHWAGKPALTDGIRILLTTRHPIMDETSMNQNKFTVQQPRFRGTFFLTKRHSPAKVL